MSLHNKLEIRRNAWLLSRHLNAALGADDSDSDVLAKLVDDFARIDSPVLPSLPTIDKELSRRKHLQEANSAAERLAVAADASSDGLGDDGAKLMRRIMVTVTRLQWSINHCAEVDNQMRIQNESREEMRREAAQRDAERKQQREKVAK